MICFGGYDSSRHHVDREKYDRLTSQTAAGALSTDLSHDVSHYKARSAATPSQALGIISLLIEIWGDQARGSDRSS